MASLSTEIAVEFPFFFRVYKDGRIERLLSTPRLPPSTDSASPVQTKDATISPHLKARIFLPTQPPPVGKKLPLVLYIHGGGFCIGSPFNTITHNFLTPLVSQTPAVAVAVAYRLAPETPLPAAHQDCWAAFQWLVSGSGPDPWINEYADPGRVFLLGESAGANLAHYVAVQAGVHGFRVRGLMAVHPYFSQKEPDKMIKYLYPGSSGSDDDPKLNAGADPDLVKMSCERVLVMVAEKDFLRVRGVGYREVLEKSKWEGRVEFVENEGEDHCFHLFNPTSEKTKGLIQNLTTFINEDE